MIHNPPSALAAAPMGVVLLHPESVVDERSGSNEQPPHAKARANARATTGNTAVLTTGRWRQSPGVRFGVG